LATGTLKKKLTVKVHAASAQAKAAVEAAGGTVELIVAPAAATAGK
jgi:ribosomal protein L15